MSRLHSNAAKCVLCRSGSAPVRRIRRRSGPSTVSHRVSYPEGEDDYDDLAESVRLVKQVIAVVDSKVNEHEKRRRLKEFHARMDSKSIMMMKSGQMFAKEDLLRRRLIHDGVLHLKSSQGRLKGELAPTV